MRKYCLLIFIEALFLFSGCSYKLINPSEKTVYVDYFSNHSLQPQLEIWLLKNLKKTIVESPVFSLVNDKENADIVINGIINDCTRSPEFISESGQIIMASYKAKVSLVIERNGRISQKSIEQVYFLELSKKFKMDYLLNMLSKKISQDIYYQLISDEK